MRPFGKAGLRTPHGNGLANAAFFVLVAGANRILAVPAVDPWGVVSDLPKSRVVARRAAGTPRVDVDLRRGDRRCRRAPSSGSIRRRVTGSSARRPETR